MSINFNKKPDTDFSQRGNQPRRRSRENPRKRDRQGLAGSSYHEGWDNMEPVGTPIPYDSPDDILLKPWEFIDNLIERANDIANEVLGEDTTIYRQPYSGEFDYSEWNPLLNPEENWSDVFKKGWIPTIEVVNNGCETCVLIFFGLMGVRLNPIIYCRRNDSPECNREPEPLPPPEPDDPNPDPNTSTTTLPAGIYESVFISWMAACEQDGKWRQTARDDGSGVKLTEVSPGVWQYVGPLMWERVPWALGRTWGYDNDTLALLEMWRKPNGWELLTIEEYNQDDLSVVTDPDYGFSNRFLFIASLMIPGWDDLNPNEKIETKSRVRIVQGALAPTQYSQRRFGFYWWHYGVNADFVPGVPIYGSASFIANYEMSQKVGVQETPYTDANGIIRGYRANFIATGIKQYIAPPYKGYPFSNISIEIKDCFGTWNNLFSTKFVDEDRVPEPPRYHSNYRLCKYRKVSEQDILDSQSWSNPYADKHRNKIDVNYLSHDRRYILKRRGTANVPTVSIAGLEDEWEILPAIPYNGKIDASGTGGYETKYIHELKLVAGLKCPEEGDRTVNFQPGTEGMRNCCSSMQCSEIIRLLKDNNDRLKKLEKVVAPDVFPVKLPRRLVDPATNDDKEQVEIENYAELVEYIVRMIDRLVGNLPMVISLDDTNDAKDGSQSYEVSIGSLADGLRELLQLNVESGGDVDVLMNVAVRNLMETGIVHKMVAQDVAQSNEIIEWLGFPGRETEEEIPFFLNPILKGKNLDKLTEESTNKILGELLQNTKVPINYYENTDTHTLVSTLAKIQKETNQAATAVTLPVKHRGDIWDGLKRFDFDRTATTLQLIRNIREAFNGASGDPEQFTNYLHVLEERYTEGSSPIASDNKHDFQVPKNPETGQPQVEIEVVEHISPGVSDKYESTSNSLDFWKKKGFGADGSKATKRQPKKKKK